LAASPLAPSVTSRPNGMLADQAAADLGTAFDEMGRLVHRRLGTKALILARLGAGRGRLRTRGSGRDRCRSVIEAEAITAPPRQTSPS
jgi:hypothetical protein